MPVEIVGTYPFIIRQRSGLYSLDVALGGVGELGIPMRTILELYGYPNVGKSTLSYYLSSKLTSTGEYTICDLENADREYIRLTSERAGMDGRVRIIDSTTDKGKPRQHEDMLGDVASALADNSVGAVVVDSIGAIQPVAEAEGDFGEAFMGKRAKLVAQVSRSFVNTLRNKERPSIAVVINHVHSIIGGRGHITAGGDTLKFLAAIRIMIYNKETFKDDSDNPMGFLVEGNVEKLRYGGRGKKFTYYIIPGYGVHQGVSAMFDCFELGLAERGTTVKMDGKSLGYINKDLLQYATLGKTRKFNPFMEALEKHEKAEASKIPEHDEDEPKEKKKK